MNYPYLPDLGDCDVVAIKRGYLDPTLSTPFENGMAQARPRFPRVRRTFQVPYRYVPLANRLALDDFIRNVIVGASGIFLWVDPATQEEIPVRFVVGKLPQMTEAGFVFGAVTDSFNLELEEV